MEPLITAAELADHIQRPITNADAGALAIAGASGAVRSYCGWAIAQEETTFKLDGSGSPVLNLPTLLLLEVTEVRLDGVALDASTFYAARRGQLHRALGWSLFSSVEADVTHGYLPVPDVVKLVALTIAARTLNNPERLKTAAVGSVSRTYDLTDIDGRLLDPYRLP